MEPFGAPLKNLRRKNMAAKGDVKAVQITSSSSSIWWKNKIKRNYSFCK
jgi:hypothetical protein